MKKQTPSEFASARLGLTSWNKFNEVFEAVEAGHRRILVRSANGIGKTTALAALCNWKLSTCEECIVLTTSSNEQQLRHNLWGEIKRQAAAANLYDADAMTDTRIKLDEKRFMIAVSPAKPESAQGYHAESILIAVDEATAVRKDILSSLIATATGDDVQIVMIYNPMTTDSFAFDAEMSGEWKVITISALEHPNVIASSHLIKGAVTAANVNDHLQLWSNEVEPNASNSFEFQGKWWKKTTEVLRRILGEWPFDSSEGIISRKLLTASLGATVESGLKTMGIDLAFGGVDETVIARFDGGIQLPFIILHTSDLNEIADAVEKEYKNGFELIAIDETGGVGALSPLLQLRNIKTLSIKFSEKPIGIYNLPHRTLANKRIEMYYHLLEELRKGSVRLIEDEKLFIELTAMRLSMKSERVPYYLEEKNLIKARIGRSPDRADATVLARYAPVVLRYLKLSLNFFDYDKPTGKPLAVGCPS